MAKSTHQINSEQFFTFCLLHNITDVEVTFHGSGDSGSIDNATINGKFQTPQHNLLIPWLKGPGPQYDSTAQKWIRNVEPTLENIKFSEAIEAMAEYEIDAAEYDWYNDDGGGGHWRLQNGQVEFYLYQNELTEHDRVHTEQTPREYLKSLAPTDTEEAA